jgi:cytidine deaminase
MKTREIKILFQEFENISQLTENDRSLLHEARKMTANAYAPYSNFHVGAAVLLADGEIIGGNNQENSSYPLSLCAERVALFYANATCPNSEVAAIAISATKEGELVKEPIKPCGACRQTMAEVEMRFGKPLRIILDGKDSILVLEGVQCLLPLSFSKKDL